MSYVITVDRRGSTRLEEWNDACRDVEMLGTHADRVKATLRCETPQDAWAAYEARVEGLRRASAPCPVCGAVIREHYGCMPCPTAPAGA